MGSSRIKHLTENVSVDGQRLRVSDAPLHTRNSKAAELVPPARFPQQAGPSASQSTRFAAVVLSTGTGRGNHRSQSIWGPVLRPASRSSTGWYESAPLGGAIMTEFIESADERASSESSQNPSVLGRDDCLRPEGGLFASEVEPEDVQWRSRARLAAGKLTDLTGNPGFGKSTLTLDWAAKYTRGWPLPDGDPHPPQGVVLLSAEDGAADTIRPRLEAAGADLDRVAIMTTKADGSLPSIRADIALIEAWIREVGAGLVVIDPLMAYLGHDINAHRDQDVRRALAPLALMAQRTNCALVTVRHLNKSEGANALYRGGGSIGIVGAARIGLLLAPDPDDREARVLAPTKSNLARLPASLQFRLVSASGTDVARIQYEGISPYTADDLVAAGRPPSRGSQRDQAVALLRQALAGGPRSAVEVKELAAAAGVTEATLRRAKDAAGVRAVKDGFGDGSSWAWELGDPDDPAP